MSKHIFVRPAKNGEGQEFLKWSLETKDNGWEPDTAFYPTSFTLLAFKGDKKLVYMPVQQPLVMDSLAVNPEATNAEVAIALKELTQALVTQAHIKGSGEIYFLASNDLTEVFAKSQLSELKELPFKLYRIKLSDLEKSNEKQVPDLQNILDNLSNQ